MTPSPGVPLELTLPTGLTLRGLQWGQAGAPHTVLAIHGWLDNAAGFWALGPALASTGECRVVALDLPGHGESDWFPAAMSYHVCHWVEILEDVLGGWGVDPSEVDLLGHSMGAGIVALYAGLRGARSVSLIEGLGPLTWDEEEKIVVQARRALSARATMQARAPRQVTLKEAVSKMMASRPGLSLTQAEPLARRQLRQEADGFRFSYDPRLQAPSLLRMTEGQVLAMLRAIKAPVLLIQAEDGLPMPEKIAQARLACFGSLWRVNVPGGHHAHMDQSEVCGDLILKHIRGAGTKEHSHL